MFLYFFFFKRKTAYEMLISDWSPTCALPILVGLTKVTGLENAGNGVTCNGICPGWVRTPLVEKQIQALAEKSGTDIEAAAKELLAEKQPSLQFVTPKQLAGAAVFLASEAADQMTGTTLTLAGGWTAR